MDRRDDGMSDQRGIVVKRDLDAERQGRSSDNSQESGERKGRLIRRLRENPSSNDSITVDASSQAPVADAVGPLVDSPRMSARLPSLGGAAVASRPLTRPQGHGPACTCVSCANQRMEKLTGILEDDSPPAWHRKVRLDDAAYQAVWPVMWTILGIAIALFILPLIPGPVPGWIDSVHHTLARTSGESVTLPQNPGAQPSPVSSPLSHDAENVARAYIGSLNAYDGNGIAAHVTERFRQSAEDQVFIANGLGSQVDIEKISAVDPCGIEICHVNITARISGSQLAGADDLEIKLTYVVKKVNGAALVDDVLN
ncbi:MAG: hypothetical protein QF898_06645 [SAR202 cluster bacterium]|jgi:hypothetical protein|nr:hypothetical protein [SAR202 cluster bacterium]MDP6514755.1 hypothetical protein [SAR202 cluster bacterium]MDP6716327.1 hypothetical protein [SAR202 cluster bacterium]